MTVLWKGQPLDAAKVVFQPDPIMGGGRPTLSGITNEAGECSPDSAESSLPGLPVGFYTVRITQAEQGIEETIGCEVADDVPDAGRFVFQLGGQR